MKDNKKLLKLIEFCILMQGHGGILNKSPDYILEKSRRCNGDGSSLDCNNRLIFEQYKMRWLK